MYWVTRRAGEQHGFFCPLAREENEASTPLESIENRHRFRCAAGGRKSKICAVLEICKKRKELTCSCGSRAKSHLFENKGFIRQRGDGKK
jgi:hypothetical protein